MRKDDCIFCKIAAGDIPSKTLYEDDSFRIILDLGPATKGHALLLPKDHYANLFEIPEDVLQKAIAVVKANAEIMKDKLGADGFNLVQNNGTCAGQTVFHFHMHMIPRYENDGQRIGWKPGEPSQEELEEIRKTITE